MHQKIKYILCMVTFPCQPWEPVQHGPISKYSSITALKSSTCPFENNDVSKERNDLTAWETQFFGVKFPQQRDHKSSLFTSVIIILEVLYNKCPLGETQVVSRMLFNFLNFPQNVITRSYSNVMSLVTWQGRRWVKARVTLLMCEK